MDWKIIPQTWQRSIDLSNIREIFMTFLANFGKHFFGKPFQSEKGQNSSTKMAPFQKRVENPQQKRYRFRRWSKLLNKNCTISEKGQNSSTKMVPFQKRVIIPRQKKYHFKKGSKFLNKNGTIPEEGQTSSTKNGTISEKGQQSSTKMVKIRPKKWYHFRQKRVKIRQKNCTISKKDQKSNKIVPFKKRVKNPRQKWYHFSQKRVIIPRQKNTISKKGQSCPG